MSPTITDHERASMVAAAKGISVPTQLLRPGADRASATTVATARRIHIPGQPAGDDAPETLAELAARAEASSSTRIRALGTKLCQLVDDLRERLAAEAAEIEAAAKVEKLRRDLARAEEQLRTLRGSPAAGSATRRPDEDPAEIRAWAVANDVECNVRGRIHGDVLEQWRAATGRPE